MRNILKKLFAIKHHKLILFIAGLLAVSFIVAQPARALISSGSLEDFQRNVLPKDSKYNKESFDAQSFIDLMNSISTGVFGCIDPKACPGKAAGSGGAVMLMAGVIDTMHTNPPASGVAYFADMGSRLNLVRPAYAQAAWQRPGTGYILSLWRGFRNAAYVLFVLVFVGLAFAIMFRTKIDPRTVITIQSVLPRIVVALVLITFSWAIAGLLLDFAHVLTRLIQTVLDSIAGGAEWWQSIANGLVVNTVLPGAFAALIGAMVGLMGGGVGAGLGAALAVGILAILFFFAVLRLTFMYLMAYVSLLLHIILGPLEILFDTLPGRPVIAGWLINVLAEVSVFVTAYAVLNLGIILFVNLTPFSSINFPILGGGTAGPDVPFYGILTVQKGLLEILKGFIGLGIMLMTPNITETVKEAIHRSVRLGGVAGGDAAIALGREVGVFRGAQGLTTAHGPGDPRASIVYGVYTLLGGRRTPK